MKIDDFELGNFGCIYFGDHTLEVIAKNKISIAGGKTILIRIGEVQNYDKKKFSDGNILKNGKYFAYITDVDEVHLSMKLAISSIAFACQWIENTLKPKMNNFSNITWRDIFTEREEN